MSLRRGVANTTGLLLLGLALFYSTRYWPQQMPLMPGTPTVDVSKPDYVTTDFHAIDLDDSGRMRYELTAARLMHFPQPERADLMSPEMIFYRNSHQEGDVAQAPWQLTAQTGVISESGERVDLSGNVNVARLVSVDSENMTLETSTLTVYGNREQAETDQPFILRAAKAELTGTGMTIDLKRGQISLHSRVRGRYDPR